MLAAPIVVVTRIMLWLLPSATIVRIARDLGRGRSASRASGRLRAQDIAWAVEAVGRRVPGATCLTQALAAHVLFLRNGQQPELCVGVAHDSSGAFRAHAWLELDGRIVVGGKESLAFTRLPGWPERSAQPVPTKRSSHPVRT